MTWGFELSFLMFLALVFASQAVATATKHYLPMPMMLGLMAVVGFIAGYLPRDFITTSNMIAVGTIAFNVLVVHSGTMINPFMLLKLKKEAIVCCASVLVYVLATIFVITPIFGREIALLAPGSVIGGGAACAIASRWVLDKAPAISVLPWMVFMFQGVFAVPVLRWAIKKEAAVIITGSNSLPTEGNRSAEPKGLCYKIPNDYKTTAYYLGVIMLVTVFNRFLHSTVLAPFGVNINVTALLLGFILGQFGLIDKAPLDKSNSYGLLLLGLMGLMVNTLSKNPLAKLLRLLLPILLSFVIGLLVLVAGALIGEKLTGKSKYRLIAMNVNCMMGFPINGLLIEDAMKLTENRVEQESIRSQLAPTLAIGTMLISNGIAIFIVSILVAMV